MKKAHLPTKKDLREMLEYDPDSGKLRWRHRSPKYFSKTAPAAKQRAWNAGWVGREAITARLNGYLVGMVFGTQVKAHRVIWKWMTGDEPDAIDHLNGDRSDNRWVNLRSATPIINQRNRKLNINNASGKPGVCWAKKTGKWQAQIKIEGKMIYLGQYKTLDSAIAAREAAERTAGFHANHGRKI